MGFYLHIDDVLHIARKYGFALLKREPETKENKKVFELWNEKNNQYVYLYRTRDGSDEINPKRVRIHPDYSDKSVAQLPFMQLSPNKKTGDRTCRGEAMTAFPKDNKEGIDQHHGFQVAAQGLEGIESLFKFVANEIPGEENELLNEISKIENSSLSDTDKQALVKVRLRQGLFKERVAAIEKACRVTGVDDTRFLIASHIMPWSKCETSDQRLDGNNGLLLSPHIDKLFDNGYISFTDEGAILISDRCPIAVLEKWSIDFEQNVKPLTPAQAYYMAHHRKSHGFVKA